MQDHEDQLAQEEYEQQQAEQAENEASESDDNSNGPGSDDPSLTVEQKIQKILLLKMTQRREGDNNGT